MLQPVNEVSYINFDQIFRHALLTSPAKITFNMFSLFLWFGRFLVFKKNTCFWDSLINLITIFVSVEMAVGVNQLILSYLSLTDCLYLTDIGPRSSGDCNRNYV